MWSHSQQFILMHSVFRCSHWLPWWWGMRSWCHWGEKHWWQQGTEKSTLHQLLSVVYGYLQTPFSPSQPPWKNPGRMRHCCRRCLMCLCFWLLAGFSVCQYSRAASTGPLLVPLIIWPVQALKLNAVRLHIQHVVSTFQKCRPCFAFVPSFRPIILTLWCRLWFSKAV